MANAKAFKACHARQFHLTSSCGLGTAYAHSIGGQDALELHSTAYLARTVVQPRFRVFQCLDLRSPTTGRQHLTDFIAAKHRLRKDVCRV